jgi:ribosome-associated protein
MVAPQTIMTTEISSSTKNTLPLNSDPSLLKALLGAQSALEKKAEAVRILNVSSISGFTDYFVICNGTSDRQVQAIADSISYTFKKQGHPVYSTEGYSEGRWILLDFGDVVVHIFLDALREYYHIEDLWSEAESIAIPAEFYGSGAAQLN